MGRKLMHEKNVFLFFGRAKQDKREVSSHGAASGGPGNQTNPVTGETEGVSKR